VTKVTRLAKVRIKVASRSLHGSLPGGEIQDQEARRIDGTVRVKKQPIGKGPGKQRLILRSKQIHQGKSKKKRLLRDDTSDGQSLRKFTLFKFHSISLD